MCIENEPAGKSIVVLGLGNILLGDEGLGVHALKCLKDTYSGQDVAFYDGGTRGLTLLPFLEEASHLLILDAVKMDSEPGNIVEIENKDLMINPPIKFSAHDIALPDLLALLYFRKQEEVQIHLLGMVPQNLPFSAELSPEVSEALESYLARAREILDSWRMES